MRTAVLQRLETSDEGTLGRLTTPEGLELWTLEPPWRNNAKGISCIPAGVYPCIWHRSPRFGLVYKLYETAPRSEVLIHSGNWAGDVSKDLRSDSRGCILPGLARIKLDDQLAIGQSRMATERLRDHFDAEPFTLTIVPIAHGGNP